MKRRDNTEQPPWADRGWYLAVEYSTLPGKERFLKRLEGLRKLGRFKELLEDGGSITYRNLFREDQLKQAWDLLTAIKPWRAKARLYLNGEELPWKDANAIVWCGGFLAPENPCRADYDARRYTIGCEHAVSFAPYQWDLRDERARHILTFARLQPEGCDWDIEALRDYLAKGIAARVCPLSPIRDPGLWTRALEQASAAAFGWSFALRLGPALKKRLGPRATQRDHAFVKTDDAPELVGEVAVELGLDNGQAAAFLAAEPGRVIGRDLDLAAGLRRAIEGGARLRVTRKGERYGRGQRRHQIEQVFHLVQWFVLPPERPPSDFPDHDIEAIPEASPGYEAWARDATKALRLSAAEGAAP